MAHSKSLMKNVLNLVPVSHRQESVELQLGTRDGHLLSIKLLFYHHQTLCLESVREMFLLISQKPGQVNFQLLHCCQNQFSSLQMTYNTTPHLTNRLEMILYRNDSKSFWLKFSLMQLNIVIVIYSINIILYYFEYKRFSNVKLSKRWIY